MREAEMCEVDAKDPIQLDLRLVVDVSAGDARPCDTSNGCSPVSDQPPHWHAMELAPVPSTGLARAYRGGRLVCGCVHVTVDLDDRLGLTARERRVVRVRFHEPVDDDVRTELTQLVRRRGTAARRAAERIDPIEVVVDDPRGQPLRIVGCLQPPQLRHGQLREIEFGLREITPTR